MQSRRLGSFHNPKQYSNIDFKNSIIRVERYQPRFISLEQEKYLSELWHISRVALSGKDNSRYGRMLYCAKEFHKKYPEISETAAYKDLDGILGWTIR